MKQLTFICLLYVMAMADDTNIEELLRVSSNHFTTNMFSEVAKENRGKNVVISAFSVMTPLAQLALASTGPSHDELLNSMGFPNDNVTKAVFSLVDRKLRSIQGIELKTANKIYIPLNYELNSDYAAVSRDVFNSEVARVDFLKSEAAANEINAWVEDQTNHRITDLVSPDSLNSDTRAVLVNALYFKGAWANPFMEYLTEEKDFHVSKDKVIKLPMMYNKAKYSYGECEILKSKLLEMPYAGGDTSMIIILPYEVDGIEELLQKLEDPSVLDRKQAEMYNIDVDVFIPKFKIETKTDLKDILTKMNVTKIFSPEEARIDNLIEGTGQLYVSNAVQKVFLEVNEEGAEAAAANDFEVADRTMITFARRFRFQADHPFVFFLKEGHNTLFSGIFYG